MESLLHALCVVFFFFFDTFNVFPKGAMGVRGPQGPRGPAGPRVSGAAPFDISQNLKMITFDFRFHKGSSVMQP